MYSVTLLTKQRKALQDKVRAVPWGQIADIIQEQIITNFERNQGPERPWTPLKPATIRYKKTNKMLYETGKMIGGMRRRLTTTAKSVIIYVYNNVEYAKYHEEGAEHIPRRQMGWLPSSVESEIEQIITSSLDRYA